MISAKRILLASAISPLAVVIPAVGVSLIVGAQTSASISTDRTESLGWIEVLMTIGAPLYLLLAAGILLTALALRRFDLLSRRSLMTVGAIAALVTSSSISCDWLATCEMQDLLFNLPLFFGIITVVLPLLVLTWWWLATREKAQPQ